MTATIARSASMSASEYEVGDVLRSHRHSLSKVMREDVAGGPRGLDGDGQFRGGGHRVGLTCVSLTCQTASRRSKSRRS